MCAGSLTTDGLPDGADTQALIWHNNYLTTSGPVLSADVGANGCGDAQPYYGILSTPTIDPSPGTLFFMTYLKEGSTLTYRSAETALYQECSN